MSFVVSQSNASQNAIQANTCSVRSLGAQIVRTASVACTSIEATSDINAPDLSCERIVVDSRVIFGEGIRLGRNAEVDGVDMSLIAIGGSDMADAAAYTSGTANIVIGSHANENYTGARAYGSGSIAIGCTADTALTGAYASGNSAIAIGNGANSSHNFSVCIGHRAQSSGANQFTLNVSGTATPTLSTIFQVLNTTPPTAGALAIPNAQAFLRVNINGSGYDIPLCNANSM